MDILPTENEQRANIKNRLLDEALKISDGAYLELADGLKQLYLHENKDVTSDDYYADLETLLREYVSNNLNMSNLSDREKSEILINIVADIKQEDNELKKGIEIEKEHKDTITKIKNSIKDGKINMSDEEIFTSIAKDHIAEHADYYKKLLSLGL